MHTNSQTRLWFQPPPRNQPLPSFVDLFVIKQLSASQADTMPYHEGGTPMQHLYGSPFSVDPRYRGMAQQHQHQYQFRAPSSGPSRNQRGKGRRKTEAQCTYYQAIHELSGATARDRFIGIHPVYVWMGAFNNPGAGGAWRPPSRNPSRVDRNSTRVTPYDRDRLGPSRTRRQRRDNVDLSIYEIPIVGSESSPNIPAVITAQVQPMLSTSVHAPTSSTSATRSSQLTLTISSEMSDEDEKTTTNVQEQQDDFDTISLGSDTD